MVQKRAIVFLIALTCFLISSIFVITNIPSVFAIHNVTASDGGIVFSINDSITTQLNMSVNNTDAGQVANITQVNVTIPTSTCVFDYNSNGSDTDNVAVFSNTSSVLSWTNTSDYIINGSETKYFWFNVTCENEGSHTLVVDSVNSTGTEQTNLTLSITDVASFSGNLSSPANGTDILVNSTYLNYSTTSGVDLNCSTYIWHNNGTLKEQSSAPASVTDGVGNYEISNSDDGKDLMWNVYCYNISDTGDDLWLNTSVNYTYSIATHSIYGYAKNASNYSQAMANTNVTLKIYTDMMFDTVYATYETNTSSTGLYNITNVSFPSGYWFKLELAKYNESDSQIADFVGPSVPEFERSMLTGESIGPGGESESLQNITFYMKKGATINISAHNGDGIFGSSNFSFYQVKDKSLGFPIVMGSSMGSEPYTNFTANLPANRNYTVMIYPDNAMPVSVDINSGNLSEGYFNYSFNVSETPNRLTGYVNTSSGVNFTSLYVVTYLLEPGRMVFLGDHASGLLNISGDDFYNTTSGFYNISVVGSAEDTNAIIMPVAFNNSGDEKYYGGFKSASLDWDGPSETNFTLKRFRSDYENPDNLNVSTWGNEPSSGAINITKVGFNFLSSTGSSVSSPFVEIQLDYSSLNMTNFTFMAEGDDIAVPLLEDVGIKKMNVFSQSGGAPMKKKIPNSSMPGVGNGTAVNTTLNEAMKMEDPDGDSLGSMYIDMIRNTDACNVPNYNISECSFFGNVQDKEGSDFNPFAVVMSGAEMSFVMKNANNITVIYKNVDMLASGPPDAAFDSDSSDTSGTSSFEQAWKFGSTGPDIYDEVMIGIPYTEGSSSQTGFNESAQMNLTIPKLYDEDYNVIWNSASGDNTTNLTDASNEEELSDFADYAGTDYEAYLNGTYPECNSSDENLSAGLCYKDTTNNMLWFKIPHFSGVGSTPTGSVITADSSDDSDDTTTSGGSGPGTSTGWTYFIDSAQLDMGYTKELEVFDRVKTMISSEAHYVKILDVNESVVKIQVSSDPQEANLLLGDLRKFDVDEDGFYDLTVTLESIGDDVDSAEITVKSTNEEVTDETIAEEESKENQAIGQIKEDTGEGVTEDEETETSSFWTWIVIILIIVLLIIIFLTRKKR